MDSVIQRRTPRSGAETRDEAQVRRPDDDSTTDARRPTPDDEAPSDNVSRSGRRWICHVCLFNSVRVTKVVGLPHRRKIAEKISARWRAMGFLSLCCLGISFITLALLTKFDEFPGFTKSDELKAEIDYDTPEWFAGRGIPSILVDYAKSHTHILKNMKSKNSKFVIYEITPNSTSGVDSFLGLVSTYMLAILTDRALLMSWPSDGNASYPNTHVLIDVFRSPGFEWDMHTFLESHHMEKRELEPVHWDPMQHMEDLTCSDISVVLEKHRTVKITSQEYYMPLVMVNPHYSETIEEKLGFRMAFADLINHLLRPSQSVADAINRFKSRYMDGNVVIGMELSVMPGHGIWEANGYMSDAQQNLFFSHASASLTEVIAARKSKEPSSTNMESADSNQDDVEPVEGVGLVEPSGNGEKGAVFLLVTDNEDQQHTKFRELEAAGVVITAGIVAIMSATGVGAARAMLEVQQLWLLGYSDVLLTTPGSRLGITAAARILQQPHVVVDETEVHRSTAPYPCLANFGFIQHASCFVPSMLSKYPPDSQVPCS